MTRRRGVASLLFAVVLLGLVASVMGAFGQGYPHCYYDDESSNIQRAMDLGAQRSLNPAWFNKPALGFYVLLAEYGAYYGLGRLFGWWQTPEDFGVHYFVNLGPWLLIGRITVAVFGALTVLLTFRAARRFLSDGASLVAALALAVTVGQVAASQHVKFDVPAAFWNTWCFLALFAVMERGRWRDYGVSGFLAGLGVATKYYSLCMMVPLTVAHWFRSDGARAGCGRRRGIWRWGFGVFAVFAGFFVGSPYNFLSDWFPTHFRRRVSWVLSRFGAKGLLQGDPSDPSDPVGPMVTPRHTVWDSTEDVWNALSGVDGAGPVICGLALVGVVAILRRPSRAGILLLCTLVTTTFFVAATNQERSLPRHLVVTFPLVALLAGRGVHALGSLMPRGRQDWAAWLAGAVLLLPVPGFPLGEVIALNQARLASDPRNDAVQWLEAHLEPDSVIVNDHDRLELVPSERRTKGVQQIIARELKLLEKLPTTESWVLSRRGRLNRYALEWRFRERAGRVGERPRLDVIKFLHPWQTERLEMRRAAASGYNDLWPMSPWGHFLDEVLAENEREPRELLAEEVRREVGRRLANAYVELGVAQVLNDSRSRGQSFGSLEELESAATAWLTRTYETLGGRWPDVLPDAVSLWTHDTPVSAPWLGRDPEGRVRPVEWFVSARQTYENYELPTKLRNFPDWAEFYQTLRRDYDAVEFNADDPEWARTIRVWDLRHRKPDRGSVRTVGF